MTRAVDCQGFAGGFTMGMVQAGHTLVGKREMAAGFGVPNCEANRHLLGYDWQSESVDPDAWSVPGGGADVVFGNPPCSGFSGLSSKDFRGIDSPINHCMWAFVDYVAKVRPLLAIFESVRAAYTKGRPLMQKLRANLEEKTGQRWDLHHVVHDAYALGGPAIRRRYFWVATRVRFGVEHPTLPFLPTLDDTIGDLVGLNDTWLPQPYRLPPTPWSKGARSDAGVVDGFAQDRAPISSRLAELAEWVDWPQGKNLEWATRECYTRHGRLPPSWDGLRPNLLRRDFKFGFSAPRRWYGDRPALVVTGAGTHVGVHPHEPRVFAFREIARIMGFPDDWRIEPLRNNSGMRATWGKGITVQAGRWVGEWIRRSLEGAPGSITGTPVGDREYEIVVSKPRTCGSVDVSSAVSGGVLVSAFSGQKNKAKKQGAQVTPNQPPAAAPTAEAPAAPAPTSSPFAQPTAPPVPPTAAPPAPPVAPPAPPTPAPAASVAAAEAAPVAAPVAPAAVEPVAPTPAAAPPAAEPAQAAAPASAGGRGRPRPDAAVQRDEAIYAVTSRQGHTKEQVAELAVDQLDALGIEREAHGTRAYQSLVRLMRAGRVERVRSGREHVWRRTA